MGWMSQNSDIQKKKCKKVVPTFDVRASTLPLTKSNPFFISFNSATNRGASLGARSTIPELTCQWRPGRTQTSNSETESTEWKTRITAMTVTTEERKSLPGQGFCAGSRLLGNLEIIHGGNRDPGHQRTLYETGAIRTRRTQDPDKFSTGERILHLLKLLCAQIQREKNKFNGGIKLKLTRSNLILRQATVRLQEKTKRCTPQGPRLRPLLVPWPVTDAGGTAWVSPIPPRRANYWTPNTQICTRCSLSAGFRARPSTGRRRLGSPAETSPPPAVARGRKGAPRPLPALHVDAE